MLVKRKEFEAVRTGAKQCMYRPKNEFWTKRLIADDDVGVLELRNGPLTADRATVPFLTAKLPKVEVFNIADIPSAQRTEMPEGTAVM